MTNEVATEQREFGLTISMPEKSSTSVVPINYQQALASFSEEEQKRILQLADSIDVRKIDNVMSYGSEPLIKTFEQTGDFLKDERGSYADQQVFERVVELTKKASNNREDFNMVLQQPKFYHKLFMKIMGGQKANARTDRIQKCALNNFNLLVELKETEISSLEMLKDAMGVVHESIMSDVESIGLLEKYIIAGHIAAERISNEINEIKLQHEQTGLQKYDYAYQELMKGYESFEKKLDRLEESRITYNLSISQLALIKDNNRKMQEIIHLEIENCMASIGQQLRNAVLDAKTREVLEGHNAITVLADELIRDVSKSIGYTAEQTEEMMYASVHNPEVVKTALNTIINTTETIKKMQEELRPKMKANLEELKSLVEKLEPLIGATFETETLEIEKNAPLNKGELKF